MPATPRDELLYYAMGGGHGHVLRGIAVLQALAGRGRVIVPARSHWLAEAAGVDSLALDEPAGPDAFADLHPDRLLVDVFPRGVIGELPELIARSGEAWLITRHVRPEFYLQPDRRRFIAQHFARVVFTEAIPNELRDLEPRPVEVDPVLMQPRRLTRSEARRVLGVGPDRVLLLVLAAGSIERQRRVATVSRKVAARLDADCRVLSLDLPEDDEVTRVFPASGVLAAADAVISAAGYHAFHETASSGVPTVYLPQNRRYDDQWLRARRGGIARDPEQLERLVARAFRAGSGAPSASWPDGASQIAGLLNASRSPALR